MALDARRLEELTLNSSAPPGQLLYDGWLLRFSPGKAKRARSVNAVYPSRLPARGEDRPLRARLRRARPAGASSASPSPREPAGLDATLAARGYERFDTTQVHAAADRSRARSRAGEVASPRLEEWFDMVGDLRGSPGRRTAAPTSRGWQRCRSRCGRWRSLEAGVPGGHGLAIVEDDHVGLFDVVTREGARRRGYARHHRRGAAALGPGSRGARRSYLQVEEGNAAAIALYAPFGFTLALPLLVPRAPTESRNERDRRSFRGDSGEACGREAHRSCDGRVLHRRRRRPRPSPGRAGSSGWFDRGFVTYSNDAKVDLLGVTAGDARLPRRRVARRWRARWRWGRCTRARPTSPSRSPAWPAPAAARRPSPSASSGSPGPPCDGAVRIAVRGLRGRPGGGPRPGGARRPSRGWWSWRAGGPEGGPGEGSDSALDTRTIVL